MTDEEKLRKTLEAVDKDAIDEIIDIAWRVAEELHITPSYLLRCIISVLYPPNTGSKS